jgi:hypothetical protein
MSNCSGPQAFCLPPPSRDRASPAGASLVLLDGDVLMAWIAGRALGFGGFPDAQAAARAAWAAHVALSRWVARRGQEVPPLPTAPRLHVAADADGKERWVLADGLPIARLVDPRTIRVDDIVDETLDAISGLRARTTRGEPTMPGARADTLVAEREAERERGVEPDAHVGFEIAVPLPVGELAVRGAAYAVYRSLCHAGLPWRLWNAGRHARRGGTIASGAALEPTPPANGARRGPDAVAGRPGRFEPPVASVPAPGDTFDRAGMGGVDRCSRS